MKWDRWDRILISMVVIGIQILLLPIALLTVLPYTIFVPLPIIRAVEEQTYWLNWYEVRQCARTTTHRTIKALLLGTGGGSSRPRGLLICRLRTEGELVRLEKRLGTKRPRKPFPRTEVEVIFFQYRRFGDGRRRRARSLISLIYRPSLA